MIPVSDTSENSWWRVVERAPATRLVAPLPELAQSQLCRDRGWLLDKPQYQAGFVKIWSARAVDLRLFYAEKISSPTDFPGNRSGQENTSSNVGHSKDQGLAWRLGLALRLSSEVLLRMSGPLDWVHPLFPYQQDGIHALLAKPHLLLADEMGLGKTVMCIAALRVLLHQREVERNLIVAPAGLLEQWGRELQKWAPEMDTIIISGVPEERGWLWRHRAHITLVSYETLRADWDENKEGESWSPAQIDWDVVALDEAQRIKNRDTDVAFVCKKLSKRRSWALTGTPLENCVEDVSSILEFVTDKKATAAEIPGGSLRTMLQQYQLRRRKRDVLTQLPPKITTDLILPLMPSQQRAYDLAENMGLTELRGFQELRELPIENVLALITKLKQICNFEPGGGSSKMNDLEGRLEEIAATDQKALIFTQYTNQDNGARKIVHRLKKFEPLLYAGDMDAYERNRAIETFNQDEAHKVLVLSLRAGGQGLNLQRASYVFHYDLWWNPAILYQAEDRAHRLGQNQPVHIYRYLMKNTIEERIESILRSKIDLFDQVVEDVSIDPKQLFTKKVLFSLVGL